MSNRWPGGLIRKTPVTPAGPFQSGAAPGVWTLADAAYWVKQGLWPTAGNFLAVEDVFSTYLYTGNSSTQTITNGIDLAGKGGMIWTKARNVASYGAIVDTVRGSGYSSQTTTSGELITWDTGSPGSNSGWRYSDISSFNSNGYSLGYITSTENAASNSYASWTFRKAPKFFDVVTWTGDNPGNSTVRNIPHNLGVAPGCIIVKRTSGASNWLVYHRSAAANNVLILNTTDAQQADTSFSNVNSTSFGVGYGPNISGSTYVAYLFAHDATADGIIQCGSFTTDSGGLASVNLGWEPQWVMVKSSDAAGSWQMIDTMRGWYNDNVNANDARLWANLTNAEQTTSQLGNPTATGFDIAGQAASTSFVYIAIRRGPMKTPTVGTSVFAPQATTGNNATSSGQFFTAGFPVDMSILTRRNGISYMTNGSRLAGTVRLYTNSTSAQDTVTGGFPNYASNTGFTEYGDPTTNTLVSWMFRRAPGFFDEVCYTGTGVAGRTITSNLAAEAQFIILKCRSTASTGWKVWMNLAGAFALQTNGAVNSTGSSGSALGGGYAVTSGSSGSFLLNAGVDEGDGTLGGVNASGRTYVAYLFSTCPGVSKVGTYTGNGSSQTINCGFSNGARFFLVKRTDSTGDWWVWDSARGITAPADPALRLNSTAAEVTSADATDPDNSGIIVNQEATCNINVNGATYIFLAIA